MLAKVGKELKLSGKLQRHTHFKNLYTTVLTKEFFAYEGFRRKMTTVQSHSMCLKFKHGIGKWKNYSTTE